MTVTYPISRDAMIPASILWDSLDEQERCLQHHTDFLADVAPDHRPAIEKVIAKHEALVDHLMFLLGIDTDPSPDGL